VQPATHDVAGHGQRGLVLAEYEARVGGEDEPVELEGERLGIFVGRELATLVRVGGAIESRRLGGAVPDQSRDGDGDASGSTPFENRRLRVGHGDDLDVGRIGDAERSNGAELAGLDRNERLGRGLDEGPFGRHFAVGSRRGAGGGVEGADSDDRHVEVVIADRIDGGRASGRHPLKVDVAPDQDDRGVGMIGECDSRRWVVRDDRDVERAWESRRDLRRGRAGVEPDDLSRSKPRDDRVGQPSTFGRRIRCSTGERRREWREPNRTAVNSANQTAVVQVTEVAANRVDRDTECVCCAVRRDSLLGGDTIEQPLVTGRNEFSDVRFVHEYACYRTFGVQNVHSGSRLDSMSSMLPSSNPDVRITGVDVLSDAWYTLRRVAFDYRDIGGRWSAQEREAYDRGNGATILLIDWDRRTVVLTRQFRMPAYLNGHRDGMLVETAAGLLDDEDAETAIRREVEEETGYRVRSVRPLFELFMSPGSVTERVAFFVAEYAAADRISTGGGVADEDEHIEVVELGLDDAVDLIDSGEICDGKTVLLLHWAQLHDRRRGTST
jgi:nudix-type nucleoside diphosphatase (YffH/AdpP family)